MHEHHSGTRGVHQFTKNNYFYGKLLTVGDMATEQAYHSGVQRTLSRFVTDWGGICGLDVEPTTVTDEETGQTSLVVTVSEGLALDRCGRLVVVGDEQRKTLPIPPEVDGSETDTVAVYVEYDECFTDPVPAAKMENACEEECNDNRIVEDAEVTLVPGAPGDYHKSIAEIDFPTADELGLGGELTGQTLAVRGDIEVSFETDIDQGRLEFTVADSGSPDTVVADVVWPESSDDPTIRGTVQVPPDSLIDPDGFAFPDGEFDVDASLTFPGEPPLEIGGSLSATTSESGVRFQGNLVVGLDTSDELNLSVDFTFDVTNGSLGINGTLESPETTVTVENPLSISNHDDANYGLTGNLEVAFTSDGGDTSSGTISTIAWTDEDGAEIPGVLVEKPTMDRGDGEEIDIDAVLAGLARSYYRNESRDACAGVDDDPVLVGILTSDSNTWSSIHFERGPLVYTNDMLFDILARHLSDFDNPHEVSLGVGLATDSVDAQVGVEESAGLTGTVGLASADDSIVITPNHRQDTIDLAAQGGLGDAFETYHVYEQSLHTTVETYSELVEDARDVWAPELVTHLAFRIARTAMHGIENGVHRSPDTFLEFLSVPHQTLYSEEQIPFDRVEEAARHVIADDRFPTAADFSIVDLERLLRATLVPNDRSDPAVPVRTYEVAVETLQGLLQVEEGDTPQAFDIALAQHRVAEAAESVLNSYPAVESGFHSTFWAALERFIHGTGGDVETIDLRREHGQQFPLGLHHRSVAQPPFGRGLVPDLTQDEGRTQERRLTHVLHRLIMSGWTYFLDPIDADEGTPSNQVIAQQLKPQTTAHKAPGILLGVHDLLPANEIEGIGDNFRKNLARFGIDTVSEVILASPSVLKIATGAPMNTALAWVEEAASMNRHLAWTGVNGIDRKIVNVIAKLERQRVEAGGGLFISPEEPDMTDDEINSFSRNLTAAAEEYDIAGHEQEILNSVNWEAVQTHFEQ